MLSVSLIHLHRVESASAASALDAVLAHWKFKRSASHPVPPGGPSHLNPPCEQGVGRLCYLLGTRQGDWTTLIQAFEERDDAPFLADLSNRLSQQLQTHALAFLLHEGDVLFYNLDYRGAPRDGYSSNPQYLADRRLSDQEALHQRHQPKAFTPLLPKKAPMERLEALLEAGWWQAYDAGLLDENGEPLSEEHFMDEEERLTLLGGLLQLQGQAGYPFAQWHTTTLIDWKRFKALYYVARGRSLPVV